MEMCCWSETVEMWWCGVDRGKQQKCGAGGKQWKCGDGVDSEKQQKSGCYLLFLNV